MDPLDALYLQSPSYRPKHNGVFWIFSDERGHGIAVDDLVFGIWEAFDGRPTDRVVKMLMNEAGVSSGFVESAAKVLARAGLLVPSQPLVSLDSPSAPAAAPMNSPPLVSVIIVAGREAQPHLATCLPSVLAQTYSNLEVILVDNQTTDESVEFTKENYPQIEIIQTPRPLGFGAANNLAMEHARGGFLFLLNDDTEMETDCVAKCVRLMAQRDRVAVVAPKMKLFYLRDFINSMGTSVHANGESYDNFTGYLDVGQFDETDQVFTACFGAALLRRSVVEQIGQIDEDYVFYYEDSDWSFRARIAGYDIVAAPYATVYHKFNATMNTLPSAFKAKLVAHSRLRFIWKNLDLERALRFTWLYRAADCRNAALAKKRDQHETAEAYRQGWRQWWRSTPRLALARYRTRRLRQPPFTDSAVFELAQGMPPPAMCGPHPVISASLIRDHYAHLGMFSPSSSSPTTALPSQPTRAAPHSRSLRQTARRLVQEEGVRGLMEQVWRYLRC